MKYFVLIPDGAAGEPMPDRDNRTCLELAATPNLDDMVREGTLGLARTVPPGMEPSSACACMSVLGYDPAVYYRGRAGIEARSMGLDIGEDEVVFRCNLVTVRDGRMWDYSAGHISTGEAAEIIESLNKELGTSHITFHSGIGYRHILKLKGFKDTLEAVCTPPHDIPGKPVAEYLPQGPGGHLLNALMTRSQDMLRSHRINVERRSRGDVPVSSIWLFWGSGRAPEMPSFNETYGVQAAMTSGVDLLRGLALMAGMTVLDIEGVTDGLDNDYAAQAGGALEALDEHDMVVIHVEAPDDAGHDGLVDEKIKAIECIDAEIIGRLVSWDKDELRGLIMPDHPTPITSRTHRADPVPYLLWGPGITSNGAARFTEPEAARAGLFMEEGYKIMGEFL
ncbi:MAG TPA: cofactor-independent phosphoglycerate mutase [Dehalococcoidia bacterium]|nr:cofactor-independent phosphoglycerate mutase [Dehalococcoidia bacterium]